MTIFKAVRKFTSTHHKPLYLLPVPESKWIINDTAHGHLKEAVVTRGPENISIPAILSPRRFSMPTFQMNDTNIDEFSSGMCFLEQTP